MDSPPLTRVTLSEHARDTLLQESRAAYPREACGALLGSRGFGLVTIEVVVAGKNRSEEPDSFVLDPGSIVSAQDQATRSGLQLVGFWHSHPDAPAILSERDRAGAWPDALQMIVSLTEESAGSPRIYLGEAEDWAEVTDPTLTPSSPREPSPSCR